MKQMLKQMLHAVCAAAVAAAVISPASVMAEENTGNADFDEFLNQEFVQAMEDDYLTMHYTIRDYESAGITKPDPVMTDQSLQSYQDAVDEANASLEKLKAFDYDSLSAEQQVDYQVYETYLENIAAMHSYPMLDQMFNPSFGIQENLLTNFTEFIFYDKQDVEDYLSVLKSVPDCLEQCLDITKRQAAAGYFLTDSQLDDTEDSIAKFTEKKDDNQLIVIFDEDIDALDFLSDDEKASYKEQNKDIVLNQFIPAYDHVSEELEKLRGSANYEGGLCNYEDGGSDYYQALVRYKTSSDDSIQDLLDQCTDFLSQVIYQYIDLMRSSDLDSAEQETVGMDTPEEILSYLQSILGKSYPQGPDVTYTASYLDPSVANDSVVAYYMQPPIDDITDNVIKINGDNVSDENELYSTLAHEGFGGHLYQITWFLNTNPSRIRSVCSNSGYTEGWGMYAEIVALSNAPQLSDAAIENLQINTSLGYVLDAAADLAVNGLGYSVDDVAEYLDSLGLNSANAESLYDFVISQPGTILPYGIGLMKFLNLREDAKEALGSKFDLKEFNTVLLTGGDRPFSMVEADVNEWVKEQGGSALDFSSTSAPASSAPAVSGNSGPSFPTIAVIVILAAAAVIAAVVKRRVSRHDPLQ